jgi:TetR/AcrR family transcriptional repressor of nem operon
MASTIEFDKDKALEKAMLLFGRQGYTAASLRRLPEAIKISRNSFYAAFTDKRNLYVEALTLYSPPTHSVLESVKEEANPSRAIMSFFEYTLFFVTERRMRRGCMMLNTVVELAESESRRAGTRLEFVAMVKGMAQN